MFVERFSRPYPTYSLLKVLRLQIDFQQSLVVGLSLFCFVLQIGKQDVNIRHIEAVGHYALKLTFTDGHDTGIYSWDYLWSLGNEYEPNWSDYLERLKKNGATRG